MATLGSLNGKLMGVYVDGTMIANAKVCKLTYTHDSRETTTKDDAGVKTIAEGLTSWKVDCDGLVVSDNFSKLFTAIKARIKVYLSFQSSVSGDYRYRGYAYIGSIDQDGPDQQSVTFSASFDGTGALTEGSVS